MNSIEAFRPLTEAGRVRSLMLERLDEELVLSMTLVQLGAPRAVTLTFRGVASLRFQGEYTELNEVVLLVAADISSRGWEGARFSVRDYEEEFVGFTCRDWRVTPADL